MRYIRLFFNFNNVILRKYHFHDARIYAGTMSFECQCNLALFTYASWIQPCETCYFTIDISWNTLLRTFVNRKQSCPFFLVITSTSGLSEFRFMKLNARTWWWSYCASLLAFIRFYYYKLVDIDVNVDV